MTGGASTPSRWTTRPPGMTRPQPEAADALLAGRRTGRAGGWPARPLGVVPGLPLALTEDLGSSRDRVPARSGLRIVHPGWEAAPAVVAAAARALAELHTSAV